MNFTWKVELLSSLLLCGGAKFQAQLFNPNDFRDLEMFKTTVVEELEKNGAVYSGLTQLHNISAVFSGAQVFRFPDGKIISQKCLEDSQDFVHTRHHPRMYCDVGFDSNKDGTAINFFTVCFFLFHVNPRDDVET